MTDERRYRDDEVAEIFESAATDPLPRRDAIAPAEGFTLAELQSIGAEAGIPPARIAAAASGLDVRRGALPAATDLGMPISVVRTAELPRALDDREWAILLGELRSTFGARGRDRSEGLVRQWNNGNLQASVEPTETGHRLRLGTLKGDALVLNRVGIGALVMALVVFLAMMLTGNLPEDLVGPAIMAALGSAALATNAVRLPRWSREREEQMEYIVARARALTAGAAEPALGPGEAPDAG